MASIPILMHGECGVLIITIVGTCPSLITGGLHQWTAEKLPNQQKSNFNYALTSSNGFRYIMVIKGMGHCLELEEFSVSPSPGGTQPWHKFSESPNILHRILARMMGWPRLPFKLWITRTTCLLLSISWLLLLIFVAGVQQDT